MRVVIDIPSDDPVAFVERARSLVEAVAHINVSIMRRVRVPSLYQAGVLYRPEPPGPEEFANCLQVLGLAPRISGRAYGGVKWADCDDAVAYRLGELWLEGEPATARVLWRKELPKSKHAQIRRANGSIEDPCMILRRIEEHRRAGSVRT